MSNECGIPSDTFLRFLASIIEAAPKDLPEDVMHQWTNERTDLTRVLRAALLQGPGGLYQPLLPLTIPHKQIRVAILIGERHYAALGYLEQGEQSIDGDTMLARIAGIGMPIDQEDDRIIWDFRENLPCELESFYIASDLREAGNSRRIRFFEHDAAMWCRYWHSLDETWDRNGLVLRRMR